jgi:hypothetical protein
MNLVARSGERELCSRFARPSWVRGLWQLGSTLGSFGLLWSLMAWSVHSHWGQGWTALLALPAAGMSLDVTSTARVLIVGTSSGLPGYMPPGITEAM